MVYNHITGHDRDDAGTVDRTMLDQRELRQTFGCFATGVTVVTTRDVAGNPRGMTANSFASVSLEPPLVMVCVSTSAPIWKALAQAGGFAVNVLADDQRNLSQRFATPLPDKFADLAWRAGPTGAPILDGVVAHLDCRTYRHVEAGDHVILLGEVVDFARRRAAPLIFAQGAYAALAS